MSFHVGTGANPVTERGAGGAVINYVEVGLGAQRTLAYLAASGVLERFPELHVVMVECGAGWLSWLLERMDEAFEEHDQWVKPKLAEPPSFYVRRQGHVTFGNDAAGRRQPRLHRRRAAAVGVRLPAPRGHVAAHAGDAWSGSSPPWNRRERRRITCGTTARLVRPRGAGRGEHVTAARRRALPAGRPAAPARHQHERRVLAGGGGRSARRAAMPRPAARTGTRRPRAATGAGHSTGTWDTLAGHGRRVHVHVGRAAAASRPSRASCRTT